MLPATKAIPKELIPVFDRPIIEHVVREAVAGGIDEVVFVTRSGKEAIENHFDAHYELEHRLELKGKAKILGEVKDILPSRIKVTSVRQHDALGLGHAILCARHLLDSKPFAVLLPDVLVLDRVHRGDYFSFSEMMRAWEETRQGQIMVEQVGIDSVENYGVVDLGEDQAHTFVPKKVLSFVEKPVAEEAPSDLAILGRYILPPEIWSVLEGVEQGVGGEIQLTDALDLLLTKSTLNAFLTDAQIFDCGNKTGFLGANLAVGSRDPNTRRYLQKLAAEVWHS
jgi:UTP--glucose-1-phosphate uridylyltransferase